MGLNKYKLGEFIEIVDERNSDNRLIENDVVGISTQKEFISTKADLEGVKLTSYKVVPKHCFTYVPDTSRRGDKMSLAYNTQDKEFLVSSISLVFRVVADSELLSDYLFMYFNRTEFDRYTRFNSWGSARETFSWDDMCDIDIVLPDITVQQKYVDIYNAMKANQKAYETGLEDLKLVCDGFIDELKNTLPLQHTSKYIEITDSRNTKLIYGVDDVKGMTITKQIIPTKADVKNTELGNFLVVYPSEFVYNPRTHGKKIGMGFNDTDKPFIISWNNTSFRVKDPKEMVPEYLFMLFSRDEWDRQSCYRSWGSSTEVFTWEALGEIKISVPDIEVQKSIVGIYKAYTERRNINEKLKAQIKGICPVLIKGSLEEGNI